LRLLTSIVSKSIISTLLEDVVITIYDDEREIIVTYVSECGSGNQISQMSG